jgi:S-adenosylmethionine:tRNA ribosyltransferase-isomerase
MVKKPSISIEAFDYLLPEEQIAYNPLEHRSDSKLLVWDPSIIKDDQYKNLAHYLNENHSLVFNNSKVIPARLFFEKQTAQGTSLIEIFCLEPTSDFLPITKAMEAKRKVNWKCLVGGAKKWKEPTLTQKINYQGTEIVINATKLKNTEGTFEIEFTWNLEEVSFSELLHLIGKIPLPPYIQRETNENDIDRYQTTYASIEGSVAAPTAGLHFDDFIFNSLREKGVSSQYLTLHVGAGTFMPVKTNDIAEHTIHAEFIEVNKSFIEWLASTNNKIVSVGTTSLRTMESLYWMGCRVLENENINNLILEQWDAYNNDYKRYSKKEALDALIQWLEKRNETKLIAATQLMITPGYSFKIANGLITNFHQPKSTLLLIIAAIIGPKWKEVYQHALTNGYRFLSYGDGGLYWINQ